MYSFGPAGADICQFFDPELSGPGFKLHLLEENELCLGVVVTEIREVRCDSTETIWTDRPSAAGEKLFAMRLSVRAGGCLSRIANSPVYLDLCAASSIDELFYDRDVSSTILLDETFFNYDTSDVLVREKGSPLVVERLGIARKIIKVVKILNVSSPGVVFLTALSQDSGLSGGMGKKYIFPNLYSESGALLDKVYAKVSVTLKNNEENRCKDLVSQRACRGGV